MHTPKSSLSFKCSIPRKPVGSLSVINFEARANHGLARRENFRNLECLDCLKRITWTPPLQRKDTELGPMQNAVRAPGSRKEGRVK